VSAYNFARFLELKIVPPTVIRNIDGKEGVIQLFVENISNKDRGTYLDRLSPVQKSNMYIFFFLTGMEDVGYHNTLISKKCLRPVSIDNDSMGIVLNQYGSLFPFRIFYIKNYKTVLSEEDYKKAPFEKALILKKPSVKTLEKTFFGVKEDKMSFLKGRAKKYGVLTYFKYKNAYWVKYYTGKFPVKFMKHLLPLNNIEDYSPQTIEKIKALDKKTIIKLSPIGKRSVINGIFHRRNLILEGIDILRKNP